MKKHQIKTILVVLILANSIFAGHHGNRKCIHDTHPERIPQVEDTIFELSDDIRRLQQSKPPRNMKFSIDMSFYNSLTNSTIDQKFKEVTEKAVEISIEYLSKLLKIIPKPANMMKWDKPIDMTCGETRVKKSDVTEDKDSDLHLYITYTNEPQEQYLAYAGHCRFVKNYGATHGTVNFNKAFLETQNLSDKVVFQDFLQTTIHEILHVLGFSSRDFFRWITPEKKAYKQPTVKQLIRGQNVTFVATPHVLEASRRYFNCTTLPGLPLENQGSSGSAGSHWETIAVLDEMMNPSSSATNSIMSVFTIALLKDTGFYHSVNEEMVEPSFYGKNKGCEFILDGTCNQQKEFCTAGAPDSCDFYQHGISTCRNNTFADAGCNNYYAIKNSRCFDNNNLQGNSLKKLLFGISFGHNSKCFQSSLLNSKEKQSHEQPLCYQYECTQDNQININVGIRSTVCTKNGEKVAVPGYSGTLTCPDDISMFCAFKKFCLNHCSTNGYCVNGTCMCNKGYSGVDCSIKA